MASAPRILIDIDTRNGVRQISALIDSGAAVSVIPKSLEPKFTQRGYVMLAPYEKNATPIKAPFGQAWISIDGKEWVGIEAAISDQTDEAIISPEGVRGYEWDLSNGKLGIYKLQKI